MGITETIYFFTDKETEAQKHEPSQDILVNGGSRIWTQARGSEPTALAVFCGISGLELWLGLSIESQLTPLRKVTDAHRGWLWTISPATSLSDSHLLWLICYSSTSGWREERKTCIFSQKTICPMAHKSCKIQAIFQWTGLSGILFYLFIIHTLRPKKRWNRSW